MREKFNRLPEREQNMLNELLAMYDRMEEMVFDTDELDEAASLRISNAQSELAELLEQFHPDW